MTDTDYAERHELVALRREVRELRALVLQISRRRENSDARLPGLLAMIFAFAHAKPWTAGELIEDARRGDRDLWLALDAIVGDRGDPAIRLGLWLQRHVDVDGDGLILTRGRKEFGAWTYCVKPMVE